MKQFKDRVHGFIELYPGEVEIINTKVMQRLRYVKQTGYAYYVFPSAIHSRFEHSLGVCHIAGRMVKRLLKSAKNDDLLNSWREDANNCYKSIYGKNLFRNKNDFEEIITRIVRIGGLVHDVGHLFYSHTAEEGLKPILRNPPDKLKVVIQKLKNKNNDFKELPFEKLHEFIGHKIIITHLKEIIAKNELFNDTTPKFIHDLLTANEDNNPEILSIFGPLRQIIDSDLDADRLDYVIRDADAAGLTAGGFELDRILQNIKIWKQNDNYLMVFNIKAEGAIAAFLVQRHFLYRQLYQHPLVSMYDFCMGLISEISLLKILDNYPKDMGLFYKRLYFAELHSFQKQEITKYNAENESCELPILYKWNIVSDDIWVETLFKYYYEKYDFDIWKSENQILIKNNNEYIGFVNNQSIIQDPNLVLRIFHKRHSAPVALWKNYDEFKRIIINPIIAIVKKYLFKDDKSMSINFEHLKIENDTLTKIVNKYLNNEILIEKLIEKILNDHILKGIANYDDNDISKYNKFNLIKLFENCVESIKSNKKDKLKLIPTNFFIIGKNPLRYKNQNGKGIKLYTEGEESLLDISNIDPFIDSMKFNNQLKPFFYLFVQHEDRDLLKKSIPKLRLLVSKTIEDFFESEIIDESSGNKYIRMDLILQFVSI
ncbi:MAG: HD domain-containing protein [Candidatus Heimdallarchaeota archaeon]|nr:HD domain-containing protein [Candidatus Heimdallarchaeota archaeon]